MGFRVKYPAGKHPAKSTRLVTAMRHPFTGRGTCSGMTGCIPLLVHTTTDSGVVLLAQLCFLFGIIPISETTLIMLSLQQPNIEYPAVSLCIGFFTKDNLKEAYYKQGKRHLLSVHSASQAG